MYFSTLAGVWNAKPNYSVLLWSWWFAYLRKTFVFKKMRVMATFLLIWDILPPLTHSWRWHSFFCCQVYCTLCLCILLSSQLFFHERRRWRWGGVRLQIREVGQEGPRGAQPPHFFGWMKTNLLFINTPSRFMSGVLDSVLGPPCLARHTWMWPCFFVVREATFARLRDPEGHSISSKSPPGVQDCEKGFCWKELLGIGVSPT